MTAGLCAKFFVHTAKRSILTQDVRYASAMNLRVSVPFSNLILIMRQRPFLRQSELCFCNVQNHLRFLEFINVAVFPEFSFIINYDKIQKRYGIIFRNGTSWALL